jgi:hypothetical protein
LALGKTSRFAGVSGSGIWVPSIATTSLPANRVTWVAVTAAGPLSRSNSALSGAGPTRLIAAVIEEPAGTGRLLGSEAVSLAHTCVQPIEVNNAPASSR